MLYLNISSLCHVISILINLFVCLVERLEFSLKAIEYWWMVIE